MIGFGEAIGLFYGNYVNFKGRASRAEYWWPTLMQLIVYTGLIVAFLVSLETDQTVETEDIGTTSLLILGGGLLFFLLVLVFWGVNIFIPVTEFARMLWFAFRGTEGNNQYGPDPYGYDGDIFG